MSMTLASRPRLEGAILAGLAAIATAALVERHRLAGQLHRAEHAKHHDPLTGLANRAGLAAAWARQHRTVTAVALLDLDGFKPVNDEHGHAAGDVVLRTVAARLAAARCGLAARLGGDEFALLLTARFPLGAARQLGAAIAAPVRLPGGTEVAVTASIGLAVAPGPVLADVLGDADAAMYRAKAARTGVAVYDPHRDDRPHDPRPDLRVRDDTSLFAALASTT